MGTETRRRFVRASAVVGAGGLSLALAAATPAGAYVGAGTTTITPSTNLVDGQQLDVLIETGIPSGGVSPRVSAYVYECPTSSLIPGATYAGSSPDPCAQIGIAILKWADNGTWEYVSDPFITPQVRKTFDSWWPAVAPPLGTGRPVKHTTTCTNQCVIRIGWFSGTTFQEAGHPAAITFKAPK